MAGTTANKLVEYQSELLRAEYIEASQHLRMLQQFLLGLAGVLGGGAAVVLTQVTETFTLPAALLWPLLVLAAWLAATMRKLIGDAHLRLADIECRCDALVPDTLVWEIRRLRRGTGGKHGLINDTSWELLVAVLTVALALTLLVGSWAIAEFAKAMRIPHTSADVAISLYVVLGFVGLVSAFDAWRAKNRVEAEWRSDHADCLDAPVPTP